MNDILEKYNDVVLIKTASNYIVVMLNDDYKSLLESANNSI